MKYFAPILAAAIVIAVVLYLAMHHVVGIID